MPGRSCQRTCPLWWAALVLERGGDRSGLAQPRGACVAGGRPGWQVPLPGERLTHTGVQGGSVWCRPIPGGSARGGRAPGPRLPRTP